MSLRGIGPRLHELQVFDGRGGQIAHIEELGRNGVLLPLVDPGDRLLYYYADAVCAYDLVTGRPLSEPPEEPLMAMVRAGDGKDRSTAAELLRRIRQASGTPGRR